jgi:hypothetical protein
MSFDGSICFFVLYHYESNAILATPIAGLDDVSIFNAYKKYFKDLTAKGFKPKSNIMDNQATWHIKKFLTENNCKLQIVEPHNHRVNATNWAIQAFKGAFIVALATTNNNFPLQLWDRLTPQVEDTLNMLRASRVDPSKSVYEILNGPYDWNRYPLAHLGAKPLSMRTAAHEDHGHPAASMFSIWGQQKIITDATIITFPTHALTVSPDPQNCFCNIASCHL